MHEENSGIIFAIIKTKKISEQSITYHHHTLCFYFSPSTKERETVHTNLCSHKSLNCNGKQGLEESIGAFPYRSRGDPKLRTTTPLEFYIDAESPPLILRLMPLITTLFTSGRTWGCSLTSYPGQ